MTYSFSQLRAFIAKKMTMSHIYQPVMLRTLISKGGEATTREIAAAFLGKDESQLEYYEVITKRMPGKVLTSHGLVERTVDGYRLLADLVDLTSDQKEELIRLCDQREAAYLERRGGAAYDHRRAALGYISGSLRYEVLSRSGSRCELCGISNQERAIEIDHIQPRSLGGTDAPENLQALCYKCNANKGARDNTDLRAVREGHDHKQNGCLFCEPSGRVIAENSLAYAIRDAYPVTPFHSLVVPKRHAATFFDLYEPERRAMNLLLDGVRDAIMSEDKSVAGFNVGMNAGEAAGQTVSHAHTHLIPRRRGDVEKPRGGVRGVIPGASDY
jgi:diadenosine tetraphosphate (Ap4A) HIT family hydrolase/5-methylcytosine-specific restriction endonuclease McrA